CVHIGFFVAYGALIAWLFRQVRARPHFGAFAILLLVIMQTPFVATTFLFGHFSAHLLSGVELGLANAIGTLLMTVWIVSRSPALRAQIARNAWMSDSAGRTENPVRG